MKGKSSTKWRTRDGVVHAFNMDQYTQIWRTGCRIPVKDGVAELDDDVDCLACIARARTT